MRRTFVVAMMWILATPAMAGDTVISSTLVVHNNQIKPEKLIFPEKTRVKLTVQNQDNLPFEFESYDLSLEVVVPPHGKRTIFLRPQKPGIYRFFNDFDHETQGIIVIGTPQADDTAPDEQSSSPVQNMH